MPSPTFRGRKAETEALSRLLDDHRLVTVTGPGGAGKTRLATEVAARLAVERPGWVRIVSLVSLQMDDDVLEEVVGQLGFADTGGLRDAAGDDDLLVVLDNCEHVLAGARTASEELLSLAPGLRVLATSRQPLGAASEHVFPLAPLAVDGPDAPAVELFLDRAAAAGRSIPDDPTVVELCRRLDGLPLAIELAAARTVAMTPAEILAHLEQRLDVLTAAPSAPGRHESLRAAIAWSYDLCDEEERQAFARLAVVPAPFTAEVATHLLGHDDALATVGLLERLVRRSLLQATPGGPRMHYGMLETLRSFALQELAARGRRREGEIAFVAAMTRLADRIALDTAGPWDDALARDVRDHHRNLRAAARLALEHDAGPERACRLAEPLLFWGELIQRDLPGHASLGRSILERWPAARTRPGLLAALATAEMSIGHRDRAMALAGPVAGAEDDPLAASVALRVLGICQRGRGESVAARRSLERAVELAREVGCVALALEESVHLAILEVAERHTDAALDRVRLLRRDCESVGAVLVGVCAANMEGALLLHTAPTEAVRTLERVRDVATLIGYPWAQASSAGFLGAAYALVGRHAEAATTALDAIARFGAQGNRPEQLLAVRLAAITLLRSGEVGPARRVFDAAQGHLRESFLYPVEAEHFGRRLVEATRGATGDATADRTADGSGAATRSPTGEATGDGPALEEVVEYVRGHLERIAAGGRPADGAPTGDRNELVPEGDVWRVTFAGTTVRLRDTKGLRDLAELLSVPGREVHSLELMGAAAADGGMPVLDAVAKRQYRARMNELQEAVEEAEANHDPARAERARAELDALVEQLAAAVGIGGRDRRAGADAERARSAVTWRIRSAIKRIRAEHPPLGEHLDRSVRTGTFCSYDPSPPAAWHVEPEPDHAGLTT